MTAGPLARIRRIDPDALSTGLGLLAAAALLVAPIVIGAPTFKSEVQIAGIPLGIVLAIGGAIIAVAAILDLLGRTELRQGIAVLALAGFVACVALLLGAFDGFLGDAAADPAAVRPYAIVGLWASSLVVGTVAFGPTRTAVLIGIGTIAVALLLPAGPAGKPFLAFAFDSAWSYALVPAGAAALVAIWRLLDLPRIGDIVLGGALAVFTQVWLQGAPSVGVACPATSPDCVAPADIVTLIWAGCLFVAFGALFGRPAPDQA